MQISGTISLCRRFPLVLLLAPGSSAFQVPLSAPRIVSTAKSRAFLATEVQLATSSSSSNQVATIATMPRGVKKENLPTKVCVVCDRPFTWRKKWERVWDEVTTCSKSCNKKRKDLKQKEVRAGRSGESNLGGAVETGDDTVFFERRRPTEASENHEGSPRLAESSSGEECNRDELSAIDLSLDTTADVLAAISLAENSDSNSENTDDEELDPVARRKTERKAAKKAAKAARRAQREGRGDPTAGNKSCDMCDKSSDLLIRCTYDVSGAWKMVCGRCWKEASGGVVDGDTAHPHYRYGGLWKNRRRK